MPDLFALSCNETASSEDGDDTSVFGELPNLWLLGMACSVVSSVATAIGTILQKKAHMMQESLPDDEKSFEFIGIVFNRYWIFALVIMAFIPLPFDFAAFALAPQSLVVTMTGLTIVLNQVFAPYMLEETLTRVEIIGTGIILVGVIFTSASAGGNPTEYNVCELMLRYGDADVLSTAIVVGCLMIFCLYLIHSGKHPPALEPLRPEMYAFVAGGFGGLMQIAFKATGELVKGVFGSSSEAEFNPWHTFWPYLLIIVVFVLAVGMISYINRGLQAYDAVLYTPLYFTNLIVVSSTLGLIYYKEYQNFEIWQMILYPFGVIIVCIGILFMTLKGVDIHTVRARVARLNKSRNNMRSMRMSRAIERQQLAQLNKSRSTRSLAALTHSVRLNRPLSVPFPKPASSFKFPSLGFGQSASSSSPDERAEVAPAGLGPAADDVSDDEHRAGEP